MIRRLATSNDQMMAKFKDKYKSITIPVISIKQVLKLSLRRKHDVKLTKSTQHILMQMLINDYDKN